MLPCILFKCYISKKWFWGTYICWWKANSMVTRMGHNCWRPYIDGKRELDPFPSMILLYSKRVRSIRSMTST